MHDLQELSGYVRGESQAGRERQDEFWERVRDQALVGELDLRENERLCAVALVKRLFPLVSRAALDWRVDATSWPSTAHIGALPWIERAGPAAPQEAERYAVAVRDAMRSPPPVDDTGSGTAAFARLDANWLHLDFVRDDRRCRLLDADDEGRAREDLIRLLKGVYKVADGSGRPLGRPSTFYALLKADGDRLGRLASEAGPELVGKALARFTREVPEIVAKHRGVTVYAGGDDLLAMLPVPGALSCAEALSNRYRSAFGDQPGATLSAAVLFPHIRLPLRTALTEAGRLLDDVAKDGNGRDSLAAGVLKPGGAHCQWVTTWSRRRAGRDYSAVRSLQSLAQKLSAHDGNPGLSSSLVYRVRETLSLLCERPRWEPGMWADLPGDLDAVAFLRAEILRSRSLRSASEVEEQAAEWTELVRAVLPRARADRETAPVPVGVDGLLLARFLADPDGWEAGP